MNRMKKHITLICTFFISYLCFAQFTITGKVCGMDSIAIDRVSVYFSGLNLGASTDDDGKYEIKGVPAGYHELICRSVGYKTVSNFIDMSENEVIDFFLERDLLSLSEVNITGSIPGYSGMQCSFGVTKIRPGILPGNTFGSAGQILSVVPGLFVDASTGDGGNVIYSRGLNPNTGNSFVTVGSRYLSLQEDGMPVMNTQVGFLWADLFIRQSLGISEIEVNRGSAPALTVSNTPGGAINYISATGTEKLVVSAETQAGAFSNGNYLYKADINLGGPVMKTPLKFNINGMYRYDQGPRDIPFLSAKGGQLKANLVIPSKTGQTTIFVKALNDKTVFFQRVPFLDIENAKPYPGFDPLYSSLYVDISGKIPDSYRLNDDPSALRNENSTNGIQVQNYYAMVRSDQRLSERLRINLAARYSIIKQDYVESFSNIVIPAATGPALIYNLPVQGSPFNFNSFSYTDVQSGELVASYVNGEEVMNKIGPDIHIGSLLDLKTDMTDKMFRAELLFKDKRSTLIVGGDASHAKIVTVWNADLTAETFEYEPHVLMITHPNPLAYIDPRQKPMMNFTDENGFFGYNYGAYNHFQGSSTIFSVYANERFHASDELALDGGVRYDHVVHKGNKERWTVPVGKDSLVQAFPLGLDGDYTTWYDAGFRKASGIYDTLKYKYPCLSGSVGALYSPKVGHALFLRISYGNKAPEMDYYINNFENVEPQKGYVEVFNQVEIGYKLVSDVFSCQTVIFLNSQEKVPFQQLVYINNTTVFTPVTFNSMRTAGIELEMSLNWPDKLQFLVVATFMNPKLHHFTYYNMNLTPQDNTDDFEEDFSGNFISEIPRVNTSFNMLYQGRKIQPYLTVNYVGKRMGNMRNTVVMPHYFTIGGGFRFKVVKGLDVTLSSTNILSTVGILSLGGLASLNNGGTEMLTVDMLEKQKQEGLPVFARTIYPAMFSLGLKFTL